MTPAPWESRGGEELTDYGVFRVRRYLARSPRTGSDRSIAVVDTADWVNVVAVTEADEVVLVRQFRHASGCVSLEVPGGIIDPGEDARAAAVRELREETGYEGGEAVLLGTVEPNPAILSNRIHTYLVTGCRETGPLQLDPGEDLEVCVLPAGGIPAAIADGRITHALVVCAFWWYFERERQRTG